MTPPAFNIITLTFIQFDTDGNLEFQIQGPSYQKATQMPWCTKTDVKAPTKYEKLYSDIKEWKKILDPWSRPKFVLVSLGGSAGSTPDRWPPKNTSSTQIANMIMNFIKTYQLDGIDIDIEGIASLSYIKTTIQYMRQAKPQWTPNKKYIITCAPEAAKGPMIRHKDIIPLCDYVGLQCYNQPPNALDVSWVLFNSEYDDFTWDSMGTKEILHPGSGYPDWSPPKADTTMWNAAIWGTNQQWEKDKAEAEAEGKATTTTPYGILVPASKHAAKQNNKYNFTKVADALIDLYKRKLLNIRYIGTWAIECDLYPTPATNSFSDAMREFLEYMLNHKIT